jgi:hypothetical protein
MGFSPKQVQALRRSLNSRYIRSRTAHGRELSYIEGWYVISEANRIFGFDAWCRETVETRCALARENRGSFLTSMSQKCASPCKPMERPLCVKVMGRAKGAVLLLAKSTILH